MKECMIIDDFGNVVVFKKTAKVVRTVKTGVGTRVKELLEQGELTAKEIVALVNEENPLRKTTYACVAWYKNDMKKVK